MWSPRGDLIAFLASQGPQQYGLYVVPPTGGTSRFLTSMAGIGLCWHPDGSSIGLIDRIGRDEPFSVFSLSIETGERRRLTVPPAGAFGDTHCSFSQDGSQLAVIRHSTRGASDVYVADASTPSRMRRVTLDGPAMAGLAWTPDGQSIVFGSVGLWKVAANTVGTAAPTLLAGAEGEARHPGSRVSPMNTGFSTSMSGDGSARVTGPRKRTVCLDRLCGTTSQRFPRTVVASPLCRIEPERSRSGPRMQTGPTANRSLSSHLLQRLRSGHQTDDSWCSPPR